MSELLAIRSSVNALVETERQHQSVSRLQPCATRALIVSGYKTADDCCVILAAEGEGLRMLKRYGKRQEDTDQAGQ